MTGLSILLGVVMAALAYVGLVFTVIAAAAYRSIIPIFIFMIALILLILIMQGLTR